MRPAPYRLPAGSPVVSPEPAPAMARQALLFLGAGVLLVVLAAPVVALAAQPFSFYATLVTGALAALTAGTLLRIGCSAS